LSERDWENDVIIYICIIRNEYDQYVEQRIFDIILSATGRETNTEQKCAFRAEKVSLPVPLHLGDV
jgi:hypothetical protein